MERPYQPSDLADLQRVWQEIHWVDDDGREHLADFLAESDTRVFETEGGVEASVTVHDGSMRHTGTDLPLAAVTAVTVSHVARKRGVAGGMVASALRDAADRGAVVAALGMFEQGFYDRLGFGTGAHMQVLRYDPADLRSDLPYRPPSRLAADDHASFAAALAGRDRGHGGVALPGPRLRRAEMAWTERGFGLGYRDGDGAVTHGFWASSAGESGPVHVRAWAHRDGHDLLELLGVLRSLGDQVRRVVLPEPRHALQLAVLVGHPGRQEVVARDGPMRAGTAADTWWQARLLDVPAAVAALRTVGPRVAFRLELADPVGDHGDWPGVAGTYRVELGPSGSTAERAPTGGPADGPTLRTTVNALTRLWLGVRPARVLAVTDPIEADDDLLVAIDGALRLPEPDVGMDF